MSLCSPRDSQESSPAPQVQSINSSVHSLLKGPTLTSIHDHWKNHHLTIWTFVSKVMSLLFNIVYICHSFSSREQVSFYFMACIGGCVCMCLYVWWIPSCVDVHACFLYVCVWVYVWIDMDGWECVCVCMCGWIDVVWMHACVCLCIYVGVCMDGCGWMGVWGGLCVRVDICGCGCVPMCVYVWVSVDMCAHLSLVFYHFMST